MPLGLAAARRACTPGSSTLANALGNGVGDDKAMYAYVPRLIEYYLGEKPLLADVPTYLCGLPEQRAEVLGRLAELVLKPVDGYGGDRVVIGPRRRGRGAGRASGEQILAAPHRWIAQEMVALSTHPVFDGDGCCPAPRRPAGVRVPRSTPPRSRPVALTRVGAGRQHDRQLVARRRVQGHLAARWSRRTVGVTHA